MSAAFKVFGNLFWGTNGAVEEYVEELERQAVTRLGSDHPLADFFIREREGFFMGKVVVLDEILPDKGACYNFVNLLDAATDALLGRGAFTEQGQQWITFTNNEMRQHVLSRG